MRFRVRVRVVEIGFWVRVVGIGFWVRVRDRFKGLGIGLRV